MANIIHPDEYKVIRVHWRDVFSYSGWHSLKEIEEVASAGCPQMQTIGWLIYQSADFILVAQSVGERTAADILKIPIPYIDDMWIQENGDSMDPKEKKEVK